MTLRWNKSRLQRKSFWERSLEKYAEDCKTWNDLQADFLRTSKFEMMDYREVKEGRLLARWRRRGYVRSSIIAE